LTINYLRPALIFRRHPAVAISKHSSEKEAAAPDLAPIDQESCFPQENIALFQEMPDGARYEKTANPVLFLWISSHVRGKYH